MARRILFERIDNFRDLGGYPCRFGETSFGVIYRSATLCYATKKDVDRLAELGIKTVLDLRDDETKARFPDPTKGDPRFVEIELPVNGNGRISKDYDDYVYSYIEMLEDPYSARNILQAIMHAEKPMVIHCNAGKDRTGAFAMLLLLLAGVDFDDINADYMLSFPYLRELTIYTREHVKEVPELLLTPDIFFLHDVYARFKEIYKTPEEYCEAIGLEDDEVELLRNVLGKPLLSCGAVIFHDGKVLVEHMTKGHYSLPKGGKEEGESEEETAVREIEEETGIKATLIPGFQETTDYSPADGLCKRVLWFVGECTDARICVDKKEVQDAYWLIPEDAIRVLSHSDDRKMVSKAAFFYDSERK